MDSNKENMPKIDLSKLQNVVMNQQFANYKPYVPNFENIKKEPEPKKGFEGWYEKHQGKITFISIIAATVLTIISIIEAYVIFKLTAP